MASITQQQPHGGPPCTAPATAGPWGPAKAGGGAGKAPSTAKSQQQDGAPSTAPASGKPGVLAEARSAVRSPVSPAGKQQQFCGLDYSLRVSCVFVNSGGMGLRVLHGHLQSLRGIAGKSGTWWVQ